jgi:DNA processing protein
VNFNASRVIAIVGTRNHSEYGKQFTEKLIKEIADYDILIVSGLAFGIDGLAHKSALKNKLATVGVVGHGLDKIYPYEHASLSKEMIRQQGGLLSEFFSGTKPDKHNFPLRNRIVAGMSDATVVIETRIKGGSMITANLANAYNRDVFALPGRVNDSLSTGCNHLIKYNKAILLTDADEMLEILGWKERKKQSAHKQRELFVELSETEKMVVDLLSEKSSVHIDELNATLNLNSSAIASALLNLELQNMITSLPGKMFKLA